MRLLMTVIVAIVTVLHTVAFTQERAPRASAGVLSEHHLELLASMEPQQQANFSKQIPYGPTNQKALPLLDSARRAVLPSSEENLARGVFQNFDWWAENGAKTGEKFNAWLLS